MTKNQYENYSLKDFDKYNCVTLSKGIYFILIFVLRAYLVWLMSVTNMKDRVAMIQWVFPQKSLFYISLFSGLIGLFVLLVITLRRPDAALWVKKCWRHSKILLTVALLFDLAVSIIAFLYGQYFSLNILLLQVCIVVCFIVYMMKNERFNINLAEFPEPFETE